MRYLRAFLILCFLSVFSWNTGELIASIGDKRGPAGWSEVWSFVAQLICAYGMGYLLGNSKKYADPAHQQYITDRNAAMEDYFASVEYLDDGQETKPLAPPVDAESIHKRLKTNKK